MAVSYQTVGINYFRVTVEMISCFARGAMYLIDIGLKMRRYRKNGDTVVTLFERTVRRHPDKVALVMVDGKSWTFHDLDLYSNTVANCFREQVRY